MKKHVKKIIVCGVVVLALVGSVVACGKSANSTSENTVDSQGVVEEVDNEIEDTDNKIADTENATSQFADNDTEDTEIESGTGNASTKGTEDNTEPKATESVTTESNKQNATTESNKTSNSESVNKNTTGSNSNKGTGTSTTASNSSSNGKNNNSSNTGSNSGSSSGSSTGSNSGSSSGNSTGSSNGNSSGSSTGSNSGSSSGNSTGSSNGNSSGSSTGSNSGSSSGSSTGSNSGNSSGSSSSSSKNEPTTEAPKTETHTHSWVAQWEIVHHDAVTHTVTETVVDKPAWTEQIKESHYICNYCGFDALQDVDRIGLHCLDCGIWMDWGPEFGGWGWSGSSYSVKKVVVDTIYHEATYKTVTKTVVDKEAYNEQVLTGYKCSCGATKNK